MLQQNAFLPPEICERLSFRPASSPQTARLGNTIMAVETREGPAILKIGRGRAGVDLSEEATRLDWLRGRGHAPRLMAQATHDGVVYTLTGRLPGEAAHETTLALDVPHILAEFAAGLKEIHAIDTRDCPFVDVVSREYEAAIRNTRDAKLDVGAFLADVGETPERVLERLSHEIGGIVEDCFTHGDYCLPNLLIENGRRSGVVDWGLAGVSNRHRDFMSAEITIKRNFGAHIIPAFYEAYGAKDVDHEKVRFFWLLDRFAHFLVD